MISSINSCISKFPLIFELVMLNEIAERNFPILSVSYKLENNIVPNFDQNYF